MLKLNNLILVDNPYDVEKYFDELSVNVMDTKELNNVVLTYSEFLETYDDMPQSDCEERVWLNIEINEAIFKLRENLYTRKAIIYNLFPSKLDHNCLNTIHLYFRDSRLSMNVYVRSMNFDVNYKHDLYTFKTILDRACKELCLSKGQITVFIMSLHKFTKKS